jgi:Ca2+-binding RTX toxin-like protein
LDVISGFEQLIGGEGDDTIVGAANNDTLQGGNGNDSLSGAQGNDILYANTGNDTLEAGTGQDIVYGGDGNDLMIASIDGSQDQYYGDNGFDILSYTNEVRDINFGVFYSTFGNGNSFTIFGEVEYYYFVEGLIGGQGNLI